MKSYHLSPLELTKDLEQHFGEWQRLVASGLPDKVTALVDTFLTVRSATLTKAALHRLLVATAKTHPYLNISQELIWLLRVKPTRTSSGVTPVTVLTKPYPCPGKCIFCPNDIRMPKSYLSNEPGAQRAERNYFDPYLQTYNRLLAFSQMGHPVDKVEIIVLGGTWSYYPESYQRWFIAECFRALNEFGSQDGRVERVTRYEAAMVKRQAATGSTPSSDPIHNAQFTAEYITDKKQTYNSLVSQAYTAPEKKLGLDTWQQASWEEVMLLQKSNETATSRCVGLVLETRPDNISPQELLHMRRLGCTKTQIGFQSLSDSVLELNHRGHDVAATRRAVRLARSAGFKIHAHWMANLYGSSLPEDLTHFAQLFSDPDFRPDELKVYPCSLIESAELMEYFRSGKWSPYSTEELIELLCQCLPLVPEYCRITRVIRDIPSPDIVEGNTFTNLREMVERRLKERQVIVHDIRSREPRREKLSVEKLVLEELEYPAGGGDEMFLQWVDPATRSLAGFLRLHLPKEPSCIDELGNNAIVREVHVYGQAINLGDKQAQGVQHQGLGTQLLEKAARVARERGFSVLSVISAVGTRQYYRSRGFIDGELYQHRHLG